MEKSTLEILVLIWVWNPHTGGNYAKDKFGERTVKSQEEESGDKTKNKTNSLWVQFLWSVENTTINLWKD